MTIARITGHRLKAAAVSILAIAALGLAAACGGDDDQQQAIPVVAEQPQQQEQPQPAPAAQQQQEQQQQEAPAEQQDAPQQQQQAPAAQQQQQQQQQAPAEADDSGGEKTAVRFSDLNWDSALLQNRIAAFIVEHGYEYPVELVPGDTVLLWEALTNGDSDVTMEMWPAQQEWYNGLEDQSIVEIVGESLAGGWEAWVIPQYVKDANPGLVSVSDLPDYIEVFTTSDSGGKARFVNCIPGWACEQVNNAKFDAYGLRDSLTIISPGSGAALFADLEGAYNRDEAWLGYMWSPTVVAGRLDLYVLEEPEWSQECWDGDKGCAYPPPDIRVIINSALADRAPEIVEFLRKWDFNAATDSRVEAWMADNNADPDAGALHYLRNYRDAWSTFVPADVAEKVDAALDALG